MRRLIWAVATVGVLSAAGSLASGRAEAMTMPGAGVAASGQGAENVALVCRRAWNGFRWVESCYRTGPRYYGYAPPPPRPYYRRRFYY